MIEYYCNDCGMKWAEEPEAIYHDQFQSWLYDNYGED